MFPCVEYKCIYDDYKPLAIGRLFDGSRTGKNFEIDSDDEDYWIACDVFTSTQEIWFRCKNYHK